MMFTNSPLETWLIYPRPCPQAWLRLFCFPYAGGGISTFASWHTSLPPDIEICPVQLPGRENRLKEPLFTRLSPLVQRLSEVIAPHLTKPFAFFGHSMGGLIGFELARGLRQQGLPGPLHLFVSGHRAPQLPDPAPPFHTLSDDELVRKLGQLNGIPEAILQHAELLHLVLPTLRADLEMCETYEYSSQMLLECPITAFGGLQDSRVSRGELAAWETQTHSTFALQMFPGDHFFLHSSKLSLLQAIAWQLLQADN